eukprot:SAG22_NODE_164_length_16817_cov_61.573573_23_plen_68_part_00
MRTRHYRHFARQGCARARLRGLRLEHFRQARNQSTMDALHAYVVQPLHRIVTLLGAPAICFREQRVY